jgi:hypothetical protein
LQNSLEQINKIKEKCNFKNIFFDKLLIKHGIP